MRALSMILFGVMLFSCHAVALADGRLPPVPRLEPALSRDGFHLSLDRSSDGHGNAVYALKTDGKSKAGWSLPETVTANYLFVDLKTRARRWLFAEPQPRIWRTIYFAANPQTNVAEPSNIRAVVYDITPGGALNDWGEPDMGGFRFCTGTNPCLPLRRIFMSKPDGRQLMALTTTFQIFDNVHGQADISQRADGAIAVSLPFHRDEEMTFDVDTFGLMLNVKGGGAAN